MVVVHRTDTDHGWNVSGGEGWTLVDRIVDARTGNPMADPALETVTSTALASQLPEYAWPEPVPMADSVLESYTGEYPISPEAVIRVFRFRGDPYIHVPGEDQARLIPVGDDAFTIRVVPGVRIRFNRDEAGAVSGVDMTLGPQTIRAEKR